VSSLFSEIKLGGLTLRNRVVVPPMCQYMAVKGLPTPWHDMHYGSMAISGAGLVIIEGTAVEDIGRISPNDLSLYNDEHEAALRMLIARARTFSSAKWGIQIAHAGRKASNEPFDSRNPVPVGSGGWIPIAPSPFSHTENWPTPKEMSEVDIARVVECFAASAMRADRAGFDVLEVHAAHGYLISSFLSPLANQRSDRYGGSLENRMRLALEVAAAIRKVWPSSKAVGFRANGTDWTESGITIDETIELAKALRREGIDYMTVSSGGNGKHQVLPPLVPGYQVFLAQAVREGSGIATITVGMILKAEQAECIVASGQSDMVGVARATLDDPRWALHAAQALGEEIAYPKSFWRLTSKYWPGYKFVHDPQASHG
jgi:2,4-dienoyl-CoA reductase-like NADH-dependent reductase (Old Yellow Enzyme family)